MSQNLDLGQVVPEIDIGTVTTLPAGSSATASMTGTLGNRLLNLGIPKGDPGEVTKSFFALFQENIPGTVQTIAFDSAGNVQSITHIEGTTAVRTDVFTFGTSTITEVRTLATGESLTIVTNTDTLETTTTYADAA